MASAKNTTNRISFMKKIIVIVVVLVITMMTSQTALAGNDHDYGSISGNVCYASLGVGAHYGSGETTCAANTSVCSVVVTVHCYYVYSSGNYEYRDAVQSGAGAGSAYATVSLPSNAYAVYANSRHVVTYGNGTPWITELFATV